ncbi:hypothetical protein [Actinomadura rudentiformis]|uniref:Uncharacterized protein n=1 Tax=Actinomadura rudentiformis TaxID=359158 RepID=A0A6H9YW13_9ACTN|nr:hypothetical protein [Actinomadura rudentiformis]KAB2344906.1 hypothetical protein F8566_30415 [Actinomadura rudentiformis]
MTGAPTHPFHLSLAQEEVAYEYGQRLMVRLIAHQGVTATISRSRQGPPEVSVGAQFMLGEDLIGLRMHVWPRHGDSALSWYRDRLLKQRRYFQYVRPLTELDLLAADLARTLRRRAAALGPTGIGS